MSLKKLGAVLLAVVVLGAVTANSAFALENQWNESTSAWYTGASPGTKLAEGTELGIKASNSGNMFLESTIGSPAVPFKLQATTLSSVGAKIKNVGTHAQATGKLLFSGVTLIEPDKEVCTSSTSVETKALTATVGMKLGSSTIDTIRFKPTEGETFATVEIKGEKCPILGTYKVTGIAYAQANNSTGVFAKSQPITLSKAIQQEASTPTTLKFGSNPAWVVGSAANALESGAEFAAKEK